MSKNIYLFSLSSHPDAISVKSLDVSFFKPTIDFSLYDYLIITSKQTVKALKQYDSNEYLSKKALAVSQKSAQEFQNIGGQILDLGEGYGSKLTKKIKAYPKNTKWLYLRAKVVASNFVQECREDDYTIAEVILYESSCSQEIQDVHTPKDATLIFTSPSSVECYLKNHTISKENRVIVIGSTTALKLPKEVKCTISHQTSIQSCIDLVY